MNGLEIVFTSIGHVNDQSTDGPKIIADANTKLLGEGGEIDSLLFVNLIVAIEELLFDERGISINLVTEETMVDEKSPFETVSSLARYVDGLIATGKE